jgi:predicted AAA+ superfamily ATPase
MDLINRSILPLMIPRMRQDRILAVTGARQTGKTTLCERQLPESTQQAYAYITFDDPEERLRFQRSPLAVLESLDAPLVIFDEVQKIPSLFEPLKVAADNNARIERLQAFILTGSSQLLLVKSIRETLAGRAALFNLHPFSLPELLGGDKAPLLDRLWAGDIFLLDEAKRVLTTSPLEMRRMRTIRDLHRKWGGFPPVWQRKDEADKIHWLKDYRKTYLERDLTDAGQVADLDAFALAQKLLCARTGSLLSVSEVARDAGLAVNTMKRYIHLLSMTFQCVLLAPYHENMGKRLIKSPKIYFTDPGVTRVILGEQSVDEGAWYESWVFSELLKWRQRQSVEPELFFYRTSGGLEVDFLIAAPDRLLPVEVKSHDRATSADGRSVETFLKSRGDASGIGLVIYPGNAIEEIRRNVWAVPDWYLFSFLKN